MCISLERQHRCRTREQMDLGTLYGTLPSSSSTHSQPKQQSAWHGSPLHAGIPGQSPSCGTSQSEAWGNVQLPSK